MKLKWATNITVNGKPFDTSRINGKEIADWVYPFMMRKVKWDGIFEELAKVIGSEKYTIKFLDNAKNISVLKEDCPETVTINQDSDTKSHKTESYNEEYEIVQPSLEDCISFGIAYLNGEGVPEDIVESKSWFAKAIRLYNDNEAQWWLGTIYQKERMIEKAIKLFKRSARLGNADAQESLGMCYENEFGYEDGYYYRGNSKNLTRAYIYYKMAAEQGLANSQNKIG